jgi:hypothetical protein
VGITGNYCVVAAPASGYHPQQFCGICIQDLQLNSHLSHQLLKLLLHMLQWPVGFSTYSKRFMNIACCLRVPVLSNSVTGPDRTGQTIFSSGYTLSARLLGRCYCGSSWYILLQGRQHKSGEQQKQGRWCVPSVVSIDSDRCK